MKFSRETISNVEFTYLDEGFVTESEKWNPVEADTRCRLCHSPSPCCPRAHGLGGSPRPGHCPSSRRCHCVGVGSLGAGSARPLSRWPPWPLLQWHISFSGVQSQPFVVLTLETDVWHLLGLHFLLCKWDFKFPGLLFNLVAEIYNDEDCFELLVEPSIENNDSTLWLLSPAPLWWSQVQGAQRSSPPVTLPSGCLSAGASSFPRAVPEPHSSSPPCFFPEC